jgi:hypothetical protein
MKVASANPGFHASEVRRRCFHDGAVSVREVGSGGPVGSRADIASGVVT